MKEQPIWMLVELCAQELTKSGNTPFTRQDLVRCVQRTRPHCLPNSINPIIQGITDNLQGGAPGAIGKNILHSVGRGRFILKPSIEIPDTEFSGRHDDAGKPSLSNDPGTAPSLSGKNDASSSLRIDRCDFSYVCNIDVERDRYDTAREFIPYTRYDNETELPLNRYGRGPFCRFSIPRNVQGAGVYALVAGNEVRYIGECENLSSRFNNGYGRISPRNCFVGGPETTCRINNLILEDIKRGMTISLWYYRTDNHKAVERNLREACSFKWNRA